MRRIVHISDLHFGRTDLRTLKPLAQKIQSLRPDLLAVSGDLTQRARSGQFREAKEFLSQFAMPQIVVPGNHDIPLFNVFTRLLRPLRKYRENFSEELEPFYADGEIAVLGLNTAHSLTLKDGRVTVAHLRRLEEYFCAQPKTTLKILVTHHPFDLPEGGHARDLVNQAPAAMQVLARCQVDLLLSGHLHLQHVSQSAARYKIKGHAALIVQAGTATSTRTRHGHANSFNVLELAADQVSVETWHWKETEFYTAALERFSKSAEGWKKDA